MFAFYFDEVTEKVKTVKEIIEMHSYVKLLETLNKGDIAKVKEMLEANIREEAAKKSGNKKPLTIINSMFKDKGLRENMKNKATLMQDGRFAFLDGHRVFIADTDLGFTDRADFKMEQLFPMKEDLDVEIDIDMAKLKEFIALRKADKNTKLPYIVKCDEDFYAGFNANFVKDLIDWAGGNTKLRFKRNIGGNNLINPAFSIDENGKYVGCILPVHIGDGYGEIIANQ